MGLDDLTLPGQTPLDPDETDGLLIPSITTRGELDEFEQHNIEQALLWTLKHSFKPGRVFSEKFIKEVHNRMYGEVWKWAGLFRSSKKNLGVEPWKIQTELQSLLVDVTYWYVHGTYPPDELAIRFKHRLVSIHCFPNGNGRHSRLMADIVVSKLYKLPVFSWGAALENRNETRAAYLSAIKAADQNDILPLLKFARS